jgi:hypothetical protein
MFDLCLDRLRTFDTEELVMAADQLRALERVTRLQRLALLAVLEEREVFRTDGCRDMASWVAARDMAHLGTARADVDSARALKDLPKLAAVAATGQISGDQLRHLAVIATPKTDATWAEAAPLQPPGRLARLAQERRQVDAETANDAYEDRYVRTRRARQPGRAYFTAYGPADEVAFLEKAIDVVRAQLGTEDQAQSRFSAREFDALIALARQKLAEAASPKATVVIHAEIDALAADGQGWAELARTGIPLASEVARRLACDCSWQLVADGPGGPIGIGRRARSVPNWLERMVWKRDGGCRFPGCGHRYGVQAHHLVHWADGGPTDLDNLVLLCWHHHHLVHEGGWSVRGSPKPDDDLAFHRRDGRRFAPAAAPLAESIYERFFGDAA